MPQAIPQAADPAGETARGWRRAMAGVPAGLWVFADQGIVSLANFAAPVLVGNGSGQEELGFFMLGFSIYMFAIGLGRAMVWTAFTRRCPQLPVEERAAYAGSATVHLAAFIVLAMSLVLTVAAIAGAVGATRYAALLVVVAPCVGVMLLREHARRLDLARHAFFQVFGFDTFVSVSQVLLLGWLAWTCRLTATTAFLSLATSSLLAAPWLLMRRDTWVVQWDRVILDWQDNWSIVKWLTGGSTAVLLGKEGYSWLLSAVYTIAELGRLGAGRILVQATNPLVIGGSNYLGPVSATVYAEEGIRGLWRYTVRTTVLMVLAIIAFLTVVALFGLPIVQAVMTKSSAGVTRTLLLTYSAGVLSEALLIPIEFASVNLGHARLMFNTAIVRLLINISIGFGLVGVFGAEAIGIGMLLGSLVALVWQWTVLAAEVRRA